MTDYAHILIDDPLPRVRRITLNRPEKRNALNNRLRGELFEALRGADADPNVSISIVRGAGPSFSAGYDLAADNQGRLLLGGTNWGSTHYIKRVTLTGTPSISLVANSGNGLAGIIEGLCVAPDDSIYALSRSGTIQRITEGPLSLTTVFSDPAEQVFAGKDLALDVDGTLYVATFESTGFGKVLQVAGGGASLCRAC